MQIRIDSKFYLSILLCWWGCKLGAECLSNLAVCFLWWAQLQTSLSTPGQCVLRFVRMSVLLTIWQPFCLWEI